MGGVCSCSYSVYEHFLSTATITIYANKMRETLAAVKCEDLTAK